MQTEDFKKFLEEKRAWYKTIKTVFCPVLNDWVIFNAKGFYHLRYDGTGAMRSRKEQQRRFKALELSIEVVLGAVQIKDFQKRTSGEYWRIEKYIKNKYISVILRRNDSGPIIFYSTWQD